MKKLSVEIYKRGEKKGDEQVKVGDVDLYYPLLSELGIAVEPESFDEKTGLPNYKEDKDQYIFDAVLAAVKVQMRNKLINGTPELKEGQKIAETLEELLAASERSGEFLKAMHEANKAFAAYVAKTGKSAAVQDWAVRNFKSSEGLQDQSDARRNLMIELLEGFVPTLSATDSARYQRTIAKVVGNCTKAELAESDLPE